MGWIKETLTSPELASVANWWPTQKYICLDGNEEQFLDDVECGEDRWEDQVRRANQLTLHLVDQFYLFEL